MRILIVHDIGTLMGGAEYSLLHIRKEMERRGHAVMVLTSDSPPPDAGYSDYTFRCDDRSVSGKLVHYLYNGSAKKTASQVIHDFNPDIIHVCTVTKLSPAGVKALRSKPCVMDLRDYGLLFPKLHKVLPREEFCGFTDDACCSRHAGFFRYYFEALRVSLHSRNYRYISKFIVNSSYLKSVAERSGMSPAINLNTPIPAAEDSDGAGKIPDSILYAGRLEPEKGIFELVDAFTEVLADMPEAALFIAGDGSIRRDIQNMIRERRLGESVKLLGSLDQSAMAAWYSKSQIVAVPSLWPEPFGRVGPEAMSHGVPVIASGRGGTTDWLQHEQNGLVADPSDRHGLAAAILRILGDRDLYLTLSANARESVKRFETGTYMDRLEKVYLEVLEKIDN